MDAFTLILIGVMGFVVVGGIGFVFAAGGESSGKTSKRLQSVAGGKTERPRGKAAPEAPGVRRKQIQQSLKAAERQERKVKLTLESRLRQAGLAISVQGFWVISGGIGLVSMLIAFVATKSPLAGVGAGFVCGLGLPRWVIAMLSKARIKKFVEEFPNAADVIVRGIKSGLPVNDCLKVISKESPEPLATEFRQLVESSAMGVPMDRALAKMYERMPTSEVRFFAIVLTIQQKTGGNLAEALNNLSSVLRARKLMGEKIKAMSGEAVASAFIIGSLPPGVMALVYFTSPTYMSQMFTDPRGHLLLLGGGIWMSLGIFVMRRMINFKF
jgi:tight adherence protein B